MGVSFLLSPSSYWYRTFVFPSTSPARQISVLHHPAHLEKFPPLTSVIAADETSQKVSIITRSEPPTRLLYYPVQAISKADPTTLSLTFPLHTRRPRDSILREIQKSSAFPSTYCGTANKGLNIEISGSLFLCPGGCEPNQEESHKEKNTMVKRFNSQLSDRAHRNTCSVFRS